VNGLPKAGLCRSITYQPVNRCALPEGHEGVHQDKDRCGWWERDAKNASASTIAEGERAIELLRAWGKARMAWEREDEPFKKGDLQHIMWGMGYEVGLLSEALAAEKKDAP
jgi:hypothetical protein